MVAIDRYTARGGEPLPRRRTAAGAQRRRFIAVEHRHAGAEVDREAVVLFLLEVDFDGVALGFSCYLRISACGFGLPHGVSRIEQFDRFCADRH